MARLDAKERETIPKKSDLALPGKRLRTGGKEEQRKAKNAPARAARSGEGKEKAEVRGKGKEKYPDIGGSKKKAGERGEPRREGRGASGRQR